MSPDFPLRLRAEGSNATPVSALVLVRREPDQFHLGLLRAAESPEPVLHFGWHRYLHDEPLQDVISDKAGALLPSALIVLHLDPAVDETLRLLARRVARKHANRWGDIMYGFGPTDAKFDRITGDPTKTDAAFTCATFVLAMLRSVGVRLIDMTSWRTPTEEDLQWQRRIGAMLLEWIERHVHGDLVRAQARVEQDIGSIRFRPTDVAGAACCSPAIWPAGVAEVEPYANLLHERLPWSSAQQAQ